MQIKVSSNCLSKDKLLLYATVIHVSFYLAFIFDLFLLLMRSYMDYFHT